ncbi:hypothetical protein C7212DRAFT_324782 [Tuber magnatum]|uniref:Uncharacterized protein n=1 Tax=Tuber magnatum TaxID=42249 RepID=A0A317SNU8_9PEZI|nr:hypothetical protein C7212DRAFT_324782 [Tuber magnatum]
MDSLSVCQSLAWPLTCKCYKGISAILWVLGKHYNYRKKAAESARPYPSPVVSIP